VPVAHGVERLGEQYSRGGVLAMLRAPAPRRAVIASLASHGRGQAGWYLVASVTAQRSTREPGFSKERRLEPHITIGLLTGQDRFPLMVSAFEGNEAETKTMLVSVPKTSSKLCDQAIFVDQATDGRAFRMRYWSRSTGCG
jgi:hypothetical protein